MDRGYEKNEVLEQLPSHLLDFVIDQPYNEYTAQDHAVWRYVMRQNINYLGRVAHKSYLKGLEKTGISIDSIPHMYGMNRILKDIGWAAVSVDGFIPPQAFMEFQAYNVLVIAADIRNIGHIQYTPAPDIIHEAAGHAPIIADEEYAKYLRRFGEIGAKAFSSKKDYELYEAIRHLSIIKENPNTDQKDIDKAEEHINWLQNNMGAPSEMALIRNLHWWTVEYGLIGTVDNYQLYGAGLLSSIGESAECMKDKVKKLPYTLEAANYSFDITTQQPQLFVTPSFEHLNLVLDQFAETMALKRGGEHGLKCAIESGAVASLEFENCVLSGVITAGKTNDACTLIKVQGRVGLFSKKGVVIYLDDESVSDLVEVLFTNGRSFKDLSNEVSGNFVLEKELAKGVAQYRDGLKRLIVIESPSKIDSAFAGPFNAAAWNLRFSPPTEKTQKIIYTDQQKRLHKLYGRVREIREGKVELEELASIAKRLEEEYPRDWLLTLEIFEILSSKGINPELADHLKSRLMQLKASSQEYHQLISDGLGLIENDFSLIH